jgi:hypothetical protein
MVLSDIPRGISSRQLPTDQLIRELGISGSDEVTESGGDPRTSRLIGEPSGWAAIQANTESVTLFL